MPMPLGTPYWVFPEFPPVLGTVPYLPKASGHPATKPEPTFSNLISHFFHLS
jgi:hypothetical protein